jgi:transposase
MRRPSQNAIAERSSQAVHVPDRSHVMPQLGQALDGVRAAEAKRRERDGYEPVWKRSRRCFLKRPEELTDEQAVKLAEASKYNLRAVRADLLREEFQRPWGYKGPAWAGKFLDGWPGRVMRSRLGPMKEIGRSIRAHRPLILNWFRAKGVVSAGAVEGLNTKGPGTTEFAPGASYGFRTAEVAKLAL